MTLKRAPGGGRKPQGEFRGKSATLTTRITPEVRQGLEREARGNKRSLSQEVERRLRDSLELPEKVRKAWGDPHVHDLARLVSLLVRNVEVSTGRRWVADPFTSKAARSAIEIILDRLMPDKQLAGPMEIPQRIETRAQSAARSHPEDAEYYRRPERLGSSHALGLLDYLEAEDLPAPSIEHPASVHYSDISYLMPRWRESLGFKRKDDR